MRCGKSWDEGEFKYVSVLHVHFQEDSQEPLRHLDFIGGKDLHFLL